MTFVKVFAKETLEACTVVLRPARFGLVAPGLFHFSIGLCNFHACRHFVSDAIERSPAGVVGLSFVVHRCLGVVTGLGERRANDRRRLAETR